MPIHAFHKLILCIAIAVYTLTAVNSKGYYHYDEHYQIIEFANLKLGLNQPGDLAWEYRARIRPAIQPTIALMIFKALNVAGVTDAYTLALSLRLVTAILALAAIFFFIRASLAWIETKYHYPYILLSYFLWFLPFLNVRFSSESWSGSLFLLATALLVGDDRSRRKTLVLSGFLLGLSFLCRFQIAFLIIGMYAWLLIVGKLKPVRFLPLTGAAGVAVMLGVAIDTWFYKRLVFTPWNYFRINIVEDVASNFGTAPWYYYAKWLFTLPSGIFLLLALVIVLIKYPRQLVVWVTIPFIIAHSLIAHKEPRFLFPLINFVPLLLILAWQESASFLGHLKGRAWRFVPPVIACVFLMINVAGLVNTSLSAVGNGSKAITYFIHKNYQGQSCNLIYQPYANPYNPLDWLDLPETFYRDQDITEINIEEMELIDSAVFKAKKNLWVVQKGSINDPYFLQLKNEHHLQLVTQSIPTWSEWLNKWYNKARNEEILLLYSGQ
jgi:phosphatidylinositol glycan class B